MMIQGAGAAGAIASVVGAVVAFKRGKTPLGAVALVLAGVFGFLALNATAFVPAPEENEFAPTPEDDFDAPL